ncbi:orotidine-5'-phosphate decarboxylase [Aerococcus sanguinicola]|uniref:orotidine-5'-phosphate decarboxylase n=1 Tax=unclassified Aerococcus TaxID=2618060 RepID=UPI0008A2C7A7|nr:MULTISPECIES: orotidine-5'-phosphate decarboxylase [unclassified Aerococcus]KAB0646614.1 orotidine-5'-phosphate decarboxylase [Aerococcus sanguinicola]MDK6233969.1 orotidine-5'-phosphate decarboxylase [Aerococcus sp. UMB10185]MDK6856474.1 orotidine-5'-phosphate decarboxylase [Aerococcus sp. UMB7533]MDK8502714.1 orotidine-5'-phosphate decarboxylase [Aerococcus sp. UMB1112A]OFN04037.1 orotidine 5'-phosphate decarboxylase [Aerococcus sp. HMSC062A02]
MQKDKPIIALDFDTVDKMEAFIQKFDGQELNVKIGMEMYYANGPALVKQLKAAGHHIFLDLKLHDIPNTVHRSIRALTELGVDMLNVHAAGGEEMMRWAMDAIVEAQPDPDKRPLLIAVTQLTSTSEAAMQAEQLTQATIEESVVHYAQLSQKAGLDGVVCSPLESRLIKDQVGTDFITVTPGIRPSNYQSQREDQERITTPAKAKALGSDYIVVGRPITQSADPVQAYRDITAEWQA